MFEQDGSTRPRPERTIGRGLDAWETLAAGNERFAADRPTHPRQTGDDRLRSLSVQEPFAAVFGCSDSRVTAEIIFDTGIGDLFVVRNAGLVASTEAIGSLEFAVDQLHVPLIVLLSHDGCGAVQAALSATNASPRSSRSPLDQLVQGLQPAVEAAAQEGAPDSAAVRAHHRRLVARTLARRSTILSEALTAGRVAVIGANYSPETGIVTPDAHPQ